MKTNSIWGLQEYLKDLGVRVDENMTVATEAAARAAVKELKAKTAAMYGDGPYARGWKKTRTGYGYVIYNEEYRLTHLLEYGHDVIGPDKKKHGRTQARPLIKPVEEETIKLFEDLTTKELNNL